MTQPASDLFSEENFQRWHEQYQRHSGDWLDKMRQISDMRMALSEAKQAMKDAEAQAIVNGEAMGSNDKQRQAALDVYLATNVPYQEVLRQSRDVQQAIDDAEAFAEYASQQMRIIRLVMEWSTAKMAAKA